MVTHGSLTSRIAQYEHSLPDHRAGTVDVAVLQAIEDLAPQPLGRSLETGCGKTTILLSNLSANHHVFAYDDRTEEGSSIQYFTGCPLFRAERTTLVLGPSQRTLSSFPFTTPIDLVLLDGPHGYPFPDLEYYYIYPHLRPGALLVVDDIHIPTIHRLYTFLVEDEMFRLVRLERTTAFFERTSAPTFYPLGDGWELQAFNKARFPVNLTEQTLAVADGGSPAAVPSDRALRELEDRLAATEKELAWWKTAAEERRLKRRLARRIGDWPFLR